MKKSLLILLGVVFTTGAMAQGWELGSNLSYMHPVGSMARNIDQGFGINLEGAKTFKSPFSLGIEFAYTGYGHQKERQQYSFGDGSVTETNVIVNNSFVTMNLTGKYFLRNTKKVNPYLSGKLGYSWFRTSLIIEDPDDEFSCHPLESDILAKDGTFIASAGVGARLDLSAIFRNMNSNSLFLDVSVHMIRGGTVKYMNVDKKPRSTPDEDVMARFINTETQVIHEHHVGNLYSSLVEIMDYKLGVIFRPRN